MFKKMFVDDEPEPEIEIGEFDNLVKEEDYHNDEQQASADEETEVKKFIEEFTVDGPAKVTSETEPQEEEEVEVEEPHLYHCSECNINFPSIQDHINSCHKGQEVVFQVC